MLSKLATLVKSKAAAAALGVLLVGGGGSAVALAASQGHLNGIGLQMASSKGQSSDQSGDNSRSKSRGHAEGMLTACDASASTISVKDARQGAVSFTVTKDTRFNGNIHGNDKGGSTSASNPTFTLADLCKLVNKVRVQVQATASTSGGKTTLTATKITVQGSGTANAGSDSGDSSDVPGKPSDVTTPRGHSSPHTSIRAGMSGRR